MEDSQLKNGQAILVFYDNMNTISISNNPIMYYKSNHVPIKYHFVSEQVAENVIKLEYVDIKEQTEDIFTKPLPRETFEYLRRKFGITFASQIDAK